MIIDVKSIGLLGIFIDPLSKKVYVNMGKAKGETSLADMIAMNPKLTVDNVEAFIFTALLALGLTKEEFIAELEKYKAKAIENIDDIIGRLET